VRPVRALSGVVAAGTVLLALVVVGASVIGGQRGFPGPGAESVRWHIVVAIVAVAAQLFSDRTTGVRAFFASTIVFAVAALLLWTQWWS